MRIETTNGSVGGGHRIRISWLTWPSRTTYQLIDHSLEESETEGQGKIRPSASTMGSVSRHHYSQPLNRRNDLSSS